MSQGEAPRKLGTFEGVFVPTSMTILGVILFVRTGWVVGELGLLGAVAVITAAFAVSTTTALSLASIVTNVRVEAGGAFALLARTLGIEAGGSIGVPLYLSQALAVAMYVFGFREGWLRLFPEHPALLVDTIVALVVFAAAAISARFAFRLQFLVLAVIAVAVASVFAGLITGEPTAPRLLAEDIAAPLEPFAVFFPAVTGIMAGVNMSGELEHPQRSIVRGSLSAVAVTFLVYLGVAVCAAVLVDPASLRESSTALVDAAAYGPLVLAGLLAATFSSALSTAVGAPRILQALARHRVTPGGAWLEHRGWRGQPHRALLLTAVIVGLGVAVRSLNEIAPLITLFFLLTYLAINLTLLVQQGLELPRFRPSFRVPLVVPALGTLTCTAAMIIVSPAFTALTLLAVGLIYLWLLRREPEGPFGQVRSGVILGLFAWVAGRLSDLPARTPSQAHLLVAIRDEDQARALLPLLRTVARRRGSLAFLALADCEPPRALCEELEDAGLLARAGRSESADPSVALCQAIDLFEAALVRPNLLVVPLPEDGAIDLDEDQLRALTRRARRAELGLWLASSHARESEPESESESDGDDESDPPWPRVELWIDAEALELGSRAPGLSLLLLSAWRARQAFDLEVSLSVTGIEEDQRDRARAEAAEILERARIEGARPQVREAPLVECLDEAGEALHLVAVADPQDPELLERLREASAGHLVVACLSGQHEAE